MSYKKSARNFRGSAAPAPPPALKVETAEVKTINITLFLVLSKNNILEQFRELSYMFSNIKQKNQRMNRVILNDERICKVDLAINCYPITLILYTYHALQQQILQVLLYKECKFKMFGVSQTVSYIFLRIDITLNVFPSEF